jgi:hypothetical protein
VPSLHPSRQGEGTAGGRPAPPLRVLASFSALGLPLASPSSLFAVYREVQDTYKSLVTADYLVSWSQLVTARLRSAGDTHQIFIIQKSNLQAF